MHRRAWVGLLLVMALAAGIRLYRLDAVEFYHDEAMLAMLAQEMADGQTVPLQGIVSSVGIPNPPTTVYSVVPPFWLSDDPLVSTGWVVLLNVAGVGLLYAVVARQFGWGVAVVAAVLYALNPWAVMYSRKLWAQDYTVPFLLLALLFTQLGFRDGRRWAQVLAATVMLWAMQIHFAAWALVPFFGWLMLAGRRRWHWPSLALSLGLCALVLTPFALGIAQTLAQDPDRLSRSLAASAGRDLDGGRSPWLNWLMLGSGQAVESWMLPDQAVDPAAWLVGGLAVGLMLLGGWVLVRRHPWAVGVAFGLVLVLPPLAFDVALSDVWPHYFVPLLPAFAVVMALAVTLARWRRVVIGLVGVCAVLWAGQWVSTLDAAASRTVSIGAGTSGYTTPAFVLREVAHRVTPSAGDVVVLTREMDIWFDSEAARWPVMLRDTFGCVRALPSDGYAVVPAGTFTVIETPDAGAGLSGLYPLAEAVTVENRRGALPYRVGVVRPEQVRAPDVTALDMPVVFDNGVSLTGYALAEGRVVLRWRLPDAPDRRFYESRAHDVQFFAHVLDAAGARVGQADARFWQARHWCAGDTLYTWQPVTGAEGAAVLRVGFYRLGQGREAGQTFALDVLDTLGNPSGNWVDIALQ